MPIVKYWFIPLLPTRHDNQRMLDAKELARRIRLAMDTSQPKVSAADVARACKVTPQAVNGWRKDGRVAKRHLSTLVELTGKPPEYFLDPEIDSAGSALRTRAMKVAQDWMRLDPEDRDRFAGLIASHAKRVRPDPQGGDDIDLEEFPAPEVQEKPAKA